MKTIIRSLLVLTLMLGSVSAQARTVTLNPEVWFRADEVRVTLNNRTGEILDCNLKVKSYTRCGDVYGVTKQIGLARDEETEEVFYTDGPNCPVTDVKAQAVCRVLGFGPRF